MPRERGVLAALFRAFLLLPHARERHIQLSSRVEFQGPEGEASGLAAAPVSYSHHSPSELAYALQNVRHFTL